MLQADGERKGGGGNRNQGTHRRLEPCGAEMAVEMSGRTCVCVCWGGLEIETELLTSYEAVCTAVG